MAYAAALFWDQFFRERRESGHDLDWGGRWTRPFLVPLRAAEARTVLELGCGNTKATVDRGHLGKPLRDAS